MSRPLTALLGRTWSAALRAGGSARALRWLPLGVCALMLLQPAAAAAQTAATAPIAAGNTRTASIGAGPVAPAQPGVISMADLGLNDDTLHGRGFSGLYFFPGPGEYPLSASGSVLELVFSATSLAGPDSAMTVSWNGVPIADIPLANSKEDRQSVKINIPTDRIDPVSNRLTLVGSLDLSATTVCRDDSPANHVTIYKETAVHYALSDTHPRPTPQPPDLGRYPSPFFDAAPTSTSSLLLLLPKNPDDDVLRATAAISAGLGHAAGSRALNFSVSEDPGKLTGDMAQANVIFIGAAKDLPGLRDVPKLPITFSGDGKILRDGTPTGQDDGVLAEAQSPANPGRMILAITGNTTAGVMKAASALSSARTARLLGGNLAVISQLQNEPANANQTPAGRRVVTLADLGRPDQTVDGLGDHTVSFKVELPGVPQGSQGLNLNLVTSHSGLLDAANSSLRVTVNGIPLNSIGLKGVEQSRDSTQVRLPPSALRSGVNSFDVTFTLRLAASPVQTSVCPAVPGEQAWAVLHNSSSLQLPTQFGSSTDADLAGYPYPFLSSTGLEKTTFVVPSQFDLNPFVRYCADLGRSLTDDSAPPDVVRANEFQPSSTNANLIIWGTPEQNPVIEQLNDNLPLGITPGAPKRYVFGSNILLSVRDSSNLGVIQEIASPWNEGRRILVISGTVPDALSMAVTALAQPGLTDNLALVSAAPPASSLVAVPIGSPPQVQVTTYKIKTKQQVATQRSAIEMLPVVLAAALGLLALAMAAIMAYEAFVREPRNRA